MTNVSLFGIRHHGPGCARSLLRALDQLQPDAVLIEGPAGCEPLLDFLDDEGLQAPVALLSYGVDDPQQAVFHPFAEFSPEWQAMHWARRHQAALRFIDVPPASTLARPRVVDEAPEAAGDHEPHDGDDATPTVDAVPVDDPLDWLARAAGYADGESWWNHMVEERGDGTDLFEAIATAMTALRAQAPALRGRDAAREAAREAHMRLQLREARKQHERIAVICGAWHVPALQAETTLAADKALLKDLPKTKTQTTWVPWTYRHLSRRSGYGAGIESPGWYEHVWRHGDDGRRVVGWFARVARLLREHELDCSSAHLIEASRLADTLAALRGRPLPGLDELNEAILGVICHGESAPMRLIHDRLMVGQRIGEVPSTVPVVPLQRDLEAQQKRLRLKPEALERLIDLDLRNDNDLQRSHLLHRLNLLGIEWGTLAAAGRQTRGSFHEHWNLGWDPSYQVALIVASRHGQTVVAAATSRCMEAAREATQLSVLASLVDRVLLADLPDAVTQVVGELDARAAVSGDALALLAALPSLANVHRYGNVRQTDAALVSHLFEGIAQRGCLGLPLALVDLADEAAEHARKVILDADRAMSLRDDETLLQSWHRALQRIASGERSTSLLRGLASRLLLDTGAMSLDDVALALSQALSAGEEPLTGAQWLDGFLNRHAAVLLHGDVVWGLLDRWLSGLSHEHFLHVVPLLRRTFSQFEAADRRDLGLRVRQVPAVETATVVATWNKSRAVRALPMLHALFGVAHDA